MPRRMRILPVLAAAGLFAAGCEFLDNLTEDKPLSMGPIHLVVRDDWTGDSLPKATCTDASGDLSAGADLNGRIAFPASPTGSYSFLCEASGYFARKVKVDVIAGAGGTAEIRLARKPGLEWYPGMGERQVSLAIKGGDFIVPGSFQVEASPRDAKHTFEYVYSTSPHREKYPARSPMSTWEIQTGTLPTQFRTDSVTVTVIARLADTSYVVGSATLVIGFTRNRPPTLQVVVTQRPVRCDQRALPVGVRSEDDEGPCRVRFRNPNRYSPHGEIDTTFSCGDTTYYFPLAAQPAVGGVAFPRTNSLRVTVTDERGAEAETTVVFHTIPNYPPMIDSFAALDAPASAIQGAVLGFRARLNDSDHAVNDAWVDWGDGEKELVYQLAGDGQPGNVKDLTFTHSYSAPGTYQAVLKTEDGCEAGTSDSLTVVVRPPP